MYGWGGRAVKSRASAHSSFGVCLTFTLVETRRSTASRQRIGPQSREGFLTSDAGDFAPTMDTQ